MFLILLIASLAAFAFSRYRFRGRSLAMGLFALGLLLPLQSYFIAQSNLFTQLEITDTRWALIIPYTAMGLPLATFLLKVFMDGLPEELFDAARIDGASDLRIYRAAGAAAAAARAGDGRHLLGARRLERVPAGTAVHPGRRAQDHPDRIAGLLQRAIRPTTRLLFSALSIVTIPMVVIYIVFNRQIVDGITAGSVK